MLFAVAPAAARGAFTPDPHGVGDPFFPHQGNGGYHTSTYDLDLAYEPGSQRLRATATIAAVATQDLSRFDLDYRGPTIDTVSIDGAPATFKRRGQELVVTPVAGITSGSAFTVEVRYRGRATNIKDPTAPSTGGSTPTTASPRSASRRVRRPGFRATTRPPTRRSIESRSACPKRLKAISNGRLASHERGRDLELGHATRRWPAIWRRSRSAAFRWSAAAREACPPTSQSTRAKRAGRAARCGATPRIMRLFDRLFGPYPFSQVGAIVDHARKIGYSLETQTRPVYDRAPNARLIAHELAHLWFGDSVSVTTWPDIWLNEGFATWAQWRYSQSVGDASPAERLRRLKREPASEVGLWNPPPAALASTAQLFSTSVYVRGAMALEALRERIGNKAYYSTLRT